MSDTMTLYRVEYQPVDRCPETEPWFECRMFGKEQDAQDFIEGMVPWFEKTRYRVVPVSQPKAAEEETHAEMAPDSVY